MSAADTATTPSTVAKTVNFVLFQAVWFAVVMSAADGRPWIGLVAVGVHTLIHLAMTTTPKALEITMLVLVTAIGLAADQLAVIYGVQIFDESFARVGFVPVWIGALWLAFATTLHSSLGWMDRKYLLGCIFGAVFGPLAYVGAEKLGGVTIGDLPRWMSLAAIGVEWAIMMPVALFLAAKFGRRG